MNRVVRRARAERTIVLYLLVVLDRLSRLRSQSESGRRHCFGQGSPLPSITVLNGVAHHIDG